MLLTRVLEESWHAISCIHAYIDTLDATSAGERLMMRVTVKPLYSRYFGFCCYKTAVMQLLVYVTPTIMARMTFVCIIFRL